MAARAEKLSNTRAEMFWKRDRDQLTAEDPEVEVWRRKSQGFGVWGPTCMKHFAGSGSLPWVKISR